TEEAAKRFGQIAQGLQARGENPHAVAHFLVQALFCLFAEDIGLLPRRVFSRLLDFGKQNPKYLRDETQKLLEAMSTGGIVAYETIPRFNGGLFRDVHALELTPAEVDVLDAASDLDWSAVEPAIFGTLFERSLDPAQRSQLGAHYTGRADIERVVDPVVMQPLERRWDEVRAQLDALIERRDVASTPQTQRNRQGDIRRALQAFTDELAAVRILDPACGSGNFLYVALERLLTLEKVALTYGATRGGLPMGFPTVRPSQVTGLELNEYAQELALVVIWIGYLQWMIGNGFGWTEPVLEDLQTIQLQDALLEERDGKVGQTVWPQADYIIGNPPFLGAKKLRNQLSDEYVDVLFKVYSDQLPGMFDLCCYFFEQARQEIADNRTQRAGLLATNSIRGGASRKVLDRIKQSGDIFLAWDDEPWILAGAAVRISIVGFDDGRETRKTIDGVPAIEINSDLTGLTNISIAERLKENAQIGFVGDVKAGKFDIPEDLAKEMISIPLNTNGRPNSDVVRPWVNGLDITRRPRNIWIIDFGVDMSQSEASYYEMPFEYVKEVVKPLRNEVKRKRYREYWWLHAEPVKGMRDSIENLCRYIVTPTVAKHRLYAWLSGDVLADHQLIVFAREDDYFFGVLHSRAHEDWSLRMGTSLEDRPRYTPTTTFETIPLPWPPGEEPVDDPRVQAIAAAAKSLNELRENWLNPPDATEAELKKRTLTNLYNAHFTWLANAHAALDRAVWAAYGWDDPDPATVDEDTILSRLLALNIQRARA
ncbi:MAG: transposase, partial [Chloroflexota bacterium]|nr:transposase [Chloroflexota bacterium]